MSQLPPGFVLDAPAGNGGTMTLEALPSKPPAPPTPLQVNADDRAGAKEGRDAAEWNAKFNPDGTPKTPAGGAERDTGQIGNLLDTIKNLRDLSGKPLAVGNFTNNDYFRSIPILGQNSANVAGALEQIQGDLIQQQIKELNLRGQRAGQLANTEKEAARMAAAIAALSQGQDYDQFNSGLDDAEEYYNRAMAASAPGSPDAPATPFDDPNNAAPPPFEISTTNESVEPTPAEKAAAAKVGRMIAQNWPLDSIRLFIARSGTGLTDNNLAEIVRQRDTPGSGISKWLKANPGTAYPYSIAPQNVPLSGLDKTRAQAVGGEVAGIAPGAALASAADVGSFGAGPDAAGAIGFLSGEGYNPAREEFVRKQQMLAAENPGSTLVGGLLGGLTSGAFVGAPSSLASLAKQSAGFSGLHGFLSSEDPSLGGRLSQGVTEAAIGGVAPVAIAPALRGVSQAAGGLGRTFRRLTGADPEQLADEAALAKLPGRLPEQDVGAAQARAAQQEALGVDPSALTAMDRSGQDTLGRMAQASPQARQVADDATKAAEQALPGQIGDDFTRAIDAAAGDAGVSGFLNRPAREIAGDVQDMAGREFEAAIKPIYQEPVTLNDELLDVLTGEFSGPAIRDALRQPGVTPETKAILRQLPRMLADAESVVRPPSIPLGGAASEQIAQFQRQARAAVIKEIGLNVESVWRIRSAMQRKASKMTAGAPEAVALRDEAGVIGDNLGPQYPEWQDANSLYASRQRAIDALDNARGSFLSDTDAVAKQAGRNSAERGAPGTVKTPSGFSAQRAVPSEREMAQAGSREAATDAAGKTTTSGVATGRNLSAPGQRDRNRITFGEEAAGKIEARTGAKVENVESLKRLRSGGTGDAGETRTNAAMQAVGDVGRGWPLAGMVAGLRAIKGVSPEESGRIVKLYTTPGKAGELMADLEKRYGRRKARFIIGRMGAIASAAQMGRSKPATDEQ